MELTLLVLAAGLGSRFGGLKQMEPVGPDGEVLLDYSVYDAIRSGFRRVVFVIREEMEADFRERLSRRFEDRIEVRFVFQDLADVPAGCAVPAGRQKPWGTAHAVFAARDAIEGPFLAINADDFYGANAYAAIADFFQNTGSAIAETPHFAMVGYRLADTLSEHGTVSRGLCRGGSDGSLRAITELTKIGFENGELANREKGAPPLRLSGEETVSMNFWGLTPAFFPHLEAGLRRFLESAAEDPKAEFYLPYAVTDLIAAGSAAVRLLQGSGTWFGMTYPGDLEMVRARIRGLVEDGSYPSSLWNPAESRD